jgi:hypothetical protein
MTMASMDESSIGKENTAINSIRKRAKI